MSHKFKINNYKSIAAVAIKIKCENYEKVFILGITFRFAHTASQMLFKPFVCLFAALSLITNHMDFC